METSKMKKLLKALRSYFIQVGKDYHDMLNPAEKWRRQLALAGMKQTFIDKTISLVYEMEGRGLIVSADRTLKAIVSAYMKGSLRRWEVMKLQEQGFPVSFMINEQLLYPDSSWLKTKINTEGLPLMYLENAIFEYKIK